MPHSTPTKSSTSGSFLFVNHDVNQIGSKPDRRSINAHSSRTWRKRELHERVKAYHAQGNNPAVEDSDCQTRSPKQVRNLILPPMVVEVAQSLESARDASCVKPHSECPQTSFVKIQGVMDRRIAIHGQKLRNLPKPLTILNKGYSNPFHTFPVDFNPATAQVLKLSRDLFVPVAFTTELRSTQPLPRLGKVLSTNFTTDAVQMHSYRIQSCRWLF
jgi:hypothetical protein